MVTVIYVKMHVCRHKYLLVLLLMVCLSQARSFRPAEDDDDDDSDDDYSDDEELQSPIDDVDPFIYFVDTVKG